MKVLNPQSKVTIELDEVEVEEAIQNWLSDNIGCGSSLDIPSSIADGDFIVDCVKTSAGNKIKSIRVDISEG